jgi:glycine/D-amino acid oxidase-like deaminating enzyme
MRRQHPLLTHDVIMAEGPIIAAWAHDLHLSADEQARLRVALEGSREQGALLEALDGQIDPARARRFAAAFIRVTEHAVGVARMKALVERAVRAVDAG